MRINKLAGLLLAGVAAVGLLSGCGEGPETISDAQKAKEALDTASSIYFTGDVEAVNQKTDILADEKVAGHMEESGFFNTKWTITVDGETWFYMKIVTDEPINEDTDEYVSAKPLATTMQTTTAWAMHKKGRSGAMTATGTIITLWMQSKT